MPEAPGLSHLSLDVEPVSGLVAFHEFASSHMLEAVVVSVYGVETPKS